MTEQVGKARGDICGRCGEPVLVFRTDTFTALTVLDGHDLPIAVDLGDLVVAGRVWHDLGPRLGWSPKYVAVRDWRPTRVTHRCADHENKHKHKHKENAA